MDFEVFISNDKVKPTIFEVVSLDSTDSVSQRSNSAFSYGSNSGPANIPLSTNIKIKMLSDNFNRNIMSGIMHNYNNTILVAADSKLVMKYEGVCLKDYEFKQEFGDNDMCLYLEFVASTTSKPTKKDRTRYNIKKLQL